MCACIVSHCTIIRPMFYIWNWSYHRSVTVCVHLIIKSAVMDARSFIVVSLAILIPIPDLLGQSTAGHGSCLYGDCSYDDDKKFLQKLQTTIFRLESQLAQERLRNKALQDRLDSANSCRELLMARTPGPPLSLSFFTDNFTTKLSSQCTVYMARWALGTRQPRTHFNYR